MHIHWSHLLLSAMAVMLSLAGCQRHPAAGPQHRWAASAGANPEIGATRPAAEDPAEARRLLTEGNARYVQGRPRAPRLAGAQRHAQVRSQAPFAVILSCSDSRAPADMIFDQNPGNLFIVRVAGNIADPATMGSIEYAVAHLRPSLVVVMGHQDCGAVKAARLAESQTLGEPENVRYLLDRIRPAIPQGEGQGADGMAEAVVANVRHQMHQLQQNPVVSRAIDTGRLQLVGATYDIGTGGVMYMDD